MRSNSQELDKAYLQIGRCLPSGGGSVTSGLEVVNEAFVIFEHVQESLLQDSVVFLCRRTNFNC